VYEVHLSRGDLRSATLPTEAITIAQQQQAPRRNRLNRDRVLRTAVALADQAIEVPTMRTLAQELGVVPMALYKHVANKEDLVDGMVDLVFGEVAFPPGGADWKPAMRQRAISMRQALLRHRWAVGLMEARMRPGPADLRHHNAVFACLREAGFSFQTTVHTYSALDSYIYGFALQEKTFPFTTPQESGEAVETMLALQPPSVAQEYPYLVEVALELGKSGYDYAVEFQVGLDLLLDSIDQLRPQWRSPAS
jgi:AcrR family transcriptional regulator